MIASALLIATLAAATPKAGELAPDFTVKDTDGKALHLAELVEAGAGDRRLLPEGLHRGLNPRAHGVPGPVRGHRE